MAIFPTMTLKNLPMKKVLILFLTIVPYCIIAQENSIEKVVLEFKYFKSADTEYRIDYKKNELTCIMKYQIHKNRDTILFNKTYKFTNEQFEKLKRELAQDIPNSIVKKSELVLDGGGFVINYYRKNKKSSKLIVSNPSRESEKYIQEFKKIDNFFDFAYSVVTDSSGIETLDETYRPYFTGLPIRKVSENPLEYKIWGNISGNSKWENNLIPFLENLPKDKCVIIDCNNQLSYAWQEDILKLYIIKNSNLRFANNSYLKYTRESLLEFRENFKKYQRDEEKLNELKRYTTYYLYTSDPEGIDKWLELPESLISTRVEEYRETCR